jgi:hypothetical protein
VDISLDRLNPILEQTDSNDAFYDPASKQLLRAIAKLAQQSPYPDLITCWVMLDLERLGDRLRAAEIEELQSIVSFPEQIFHPIKGKATETLSKLLPIKVEGTELDRRRPEAERLLPLPITISESEDTANESQAFTDFFNREFRSRKLIELGTEQAAQRVAWLLKGLHLHSNQVLVPDCNLDESTIDTIARNVGTSWQYVEDNDELDIIENESERQKNLFRAISESIARFSDCVSIAHEIAQRLPEPSNNPSQNASVHAPLFSLSAQAKPLGLAVSMDEPMPDNQQHSLLETASKLTETLNSIHLPYIVEDYITAILKKLNKECLENGQNTAYINKRCLEPMPFPSPIMLQRIVARMSKDGFIFSSFWSDSFKISVPWHDEISSQTQDQVSKTIVDFSTELVPGQNKSTFNKRSNLRKLLFFGLSTITLLLGSAMSVAISFSTYTYLEFSGKSISRIILSTEISESERIQAVVGAFILNTLPALITFGFTLKASSALYDNIFREINRQYSHEIDDSN